MFSDLLDFHSVPYEQGKRQLLVDCPSCGKEKHLYANNDTGQWDCKVCGLSGNKYTFLTLLADVSSTQTSVTERKQLAKTRGLKSATLKRFGVAKCLFQDGWYLPARNRKGTVRNLYKYAGKNIYSTTDCSPQLLGLDTLKPKKQIILCEGHWDHIACDFALRTSKMTKEFHALGVPGANVFEEDWIRWFRGREVWMVYDNDQAGEDGMDRVSVMLKETVSTLHRIDWGDQPAGFDFRDLLLGETNG